MTPPAAASTFDMRLIQRGARLRRSPYFEATQRYGCRAYTVYNPMFLPSYYDDPVDEYWHLLEHVTLWDVGVERQVEITGPDAFRFTNLLTPRDLNACRVGQGRYALITLESRAGPRPLRGRVQRAFLAGGHSRALRSHVQGRNGGIGGKGRQRLRMSQ